MESLRNCISHWGLNLQNWGGREDDECKSSGGLAGGSGCDNSSLDSKSARKGNSPITNELGILECA